LSQHKFIKIWENYIRVLNAPRKEGRGSPQKKRRPRTRERRQGEDKQRERKNRERREIGLFKDLCANLENCRDLLAK
jgi:hypothetical protein